MDVRDLRYFAVAAELGHLHRAAERLGRTQPALSKCIRRLETELGATLFEREGRGIRLTPVGEGLLLHARRISQSLNEAVRQVTETARGDSGHVRIGSGPTAAEWLLPAVFGDVLAKTPAVTFEVVTGLGAMLRRLLREGKLDLVISPSIETDAAEFAIVPLGKDTMVVAARLAHPLGDKRVRLTDLLPYNWLLPAASMNSTAWLCRAFAARKLPAPIVRIEVNSVMPLRRLVAQTDLLTLLSRRDLRGEGGMMLSEIDIPVLALYRNFSVLSVEDRYKSPAAQRLIDHLRRNGKALFADAASTGP
jgi:DNA-binding transcriptional LysR family regulator